jgi:hypothetical protein
MIGYSLWQQLSSDVLLCYGTALPMENQNDINWQILDQDYETLIA